MKSNSILRHALMLAGPLALFLQGNALGQAHEGTNTAPAAQPPAARAGTKLDFWTSVDFYFRGGTPRMFLDAVDKQYEVDWSSVADIPSEMANVRIPKLRLSRESMERILPNSGRGRMRGFGGGGGGFGGMVEDEQRNPLDALVALYNNLQQARPELGRMIVEGDPAKPSIVLFRSSNPSAPILLKIKAFPLKGIPPIEWDKLAAELVQQFALLAEANHEGPNPPRTDVTMHADSGLLIVIGPESYMEAAESLVAACHANHPAPPPAPPPIVK